MKLKIKRPVTFEGTVQEMSVEDIRARIGSREYEAIKAEDPHPMFLDLRVGKQGASYGSLIVGGVKKAIKKLWGAPRIKELANLISRGSVIMFRHGETNDQAGREKVGRTIKGWTETEGDSLVARGVAYISSKFAGVQEMVREKVIDACSLEAPLRFHVGGPSHVVIDKVLGLTAIALCRTGVDGVPGFGGETIVGAVQEMGKLKDLLDQAGIDVDDVTVAGDDTPPDGNVGRSRRRGRRRTVEERDVRLSDVKLFVEEGGISPSKIYSLDKLLDEPAVKDAVQAEVKEQLTTKTTEHDAKVAELEGELAKKDTTIKERDASIDSINKELEPHKGAVRKTKVVDLVKKSALMENVPKEKSDYISEQLSKSLPADLDLATDAGGVAVEAAIKTQMDDIKRLGITFGEEEPEQHSENENEDEEGYGTKPNQTVTKSPQQEVADTKKAFSAGINVLEPGAVATHKKGDK